MVRRATKTGNKNQRPNSYAGRALKVWMLAEFGDGITVACSFGCGKQLFYSEITKDRFPIPGRKGGKYAKGNVRPACMSCNAAEGARQAAVERALATLKRNLRNEKRRFQYRVRKGLIMSFEDIQSDITNSTSWAAVTGEQILASIHELHASRTAADPKNIVWDYTDYTPAGKAIFMDRTLFEDGRHHIYLNPEHRPMIEAWLATL